MGQDFFSWSGIAVLSHFTRLTLVGTIVAGGVVTLAATSAKADPYSLPIASSGPVVLPPVADDGTIAARQLAAQVGLPQFTSSSWKPGLLRHVVMFRYKSSATPAMRAEVTARFLRLVQDSRRPDGTHPVKSIEMGMQNSGEGVDAGLQQAFIVTFASEGDRNFYVGKPVIMDPAWFDPAHEAFKEFAAPAIEKVVVFDFDVLASASLEPSRHKMSSHRGNTQTRR
ncbi:Dabb family protein [Asaia prunellae]|uniref:Dabb family protein n=1 Tax=Asaia prunellae TaxID=610245 RepID=UPI00046F7C8C|nr:Dabb family protein [Asaia prunellae]